jgi:hypothetical protein
MCSIGPRGDIFDDEHVGRTDLVEDMFALVQHESPDGVGMNVVGLSFSQGFQTDGTILYVAVTKYDLLQYLRC